MIASIIPFLFKLKFFLVFDESNEFALSLNPKSHYNMNCKIFLYIINCRVGMGSKVSTEGEVYFGVFQLEMFLGKRPTDEMFKDDLNLHSFVKMALPEQLVQIVDPTLLIREVEEILVAIVAAREYSNENEIEADEETQGIVNHCQVEAYVYKCLVSVLEIGLACSLDSPKERMKEEVSKELHSIKNAILGSSN